jgi:hypothetical protein
MLRHKPTLKTFADTEKARRHYAAYSAEQSPIGAGISFDPSTPDLLEQLNVVGYYRDETPAHDQSAQILTGDFVWDDVKAIVVQKVRNLTTAEIAANFKATVPRSVSMRQARVYLSRASLLDLVSAQIADTSGEAQIVWEYSQEVQRDNPLISNMAAALGWTEEQLDQMFIDAAQL